MKIGNNQLFNPDTLNIFTDASTIEIDKTQGLYRTSAGAVCVMTSPDGETRIINEVCTVIENSTNNFGELFGIYSGVLKALEYRYQFNRINIISDSQFAVYGLTRWIWNWRNNIQDDMYMNSSGKEVVNQDLFKRIINLILYNGLYINIYHQKGHCLNHPGRSKRTFFTSNGIELNLVESRLIGKYNDYVDRYSRKQLQIKGADIVFPLYYYGDFNKGSYRKLVNNRNIF